MSYQPVTPQPEDNRAESPLLKWGKIALVCTLISIVVGCMACGAHA